MSTEAIVLIVVAAALLLGLFLLIATRPKRRARKELHQSRERAAGAHREAAQAGQQRAAAAEQERDRAKREALEAEERLRLARMKTKSADERAASERREASMHENRAELHKRGEADAELGLSEPRKETDRDLRSERDVVIGDEGTGTSTGRRFRRDEPAPATDPERATSGTTRNRPPAP